MNFLSGRGAEEPTVYGWNTKVSAPFGKEVKTIIVVDTSLHSLKLLACLLKEQVSSLTCFPMWDILTKLFCVSQWKFLRIMTFDLSRRLMT